MNSCEDRGAGAEAVWSLGEGQAPGWHTNDDRSRDLAIREREHECGHLQWQVMWWWRLVQSADGGRFEGEGHVRGIGTRDREVSRTRANDEVRTFHAHGNVSKFAVEIGVSGDV